MRIKWKNMTRMGHSNLFRQNRNQESINWSRLFRRLSNRRMGWQILRGNWSAVLLNCIKNSWVNREKWRWINRNSSIKSTIRSLIMSIKTWNKIRDRDRLSVTRSITQYNLTGAKRLRRQHSVAEQKNLRPRFRISASVHRRERSAKNREFSYNRAKVKKISRNLLLHPRWMWEAKVKIATF